jgi:hypothetical protein
VKDFYELTDKYNVSKKGMYRIIVPVSLSFGYYNSYDLHAEFVVK